MKNSMKGALLSGLVFPGLGEVILKYYKRGAVLMLAVSASLLVILIKAVQQAFAILEKIQSKGGVIDMGMIWKAATQGSTSFGSLTLKIALLVLVFCWIIAVVDAYRIGRKKDIEEREGQGLRL